jgi:hypothetical protein
MPMRRHAFPAFRTSLPILLALCLAATPVPAQEAPKRAGVPDAAAQAKAEEVMHRQHKEAFAKAQLFDPDARLNLAGVLLDQGAQLQNDAAVRYVCLREARDLAAGIGNLSLALRAVAEMEQAFVVDAPELKVGTVAAVVASARKTEAAKLLVESVLDLIAQAVDADAYGMALRLGKLAEDAARKAKSLPLVLSVQKYNRGVAAAAKQFEGLRPFTDRLGKDPEDAEANLAVGRYLCLLKGTWERGLFLLAQGNDPALRRLAQRDLTRPESAAEQIEMGDAWWDQADKEEAQARIHVRQRAVFWYEQAVASSEGLVRGRLEERIAQVPRPPSRLPGWDYSGTPRELQVFRGNNNTVFATAFLPDGRRVISGDVNGLGIVWDAATGKQLQRLPAHAGLIWSVACEAKGRHIFSAAWDGTVKMVDGSNGREVRRFPANGRLANLNGVAVSLDGKRMLTGSDDNVVRLWDVDKGQELKQLRGHAGPVYGVAISPDGRQGLSGGSQDGTMILWDLQTFKEVRRFQGLAANIRTVAISPDGRQALSSGENDVRLWDLKTGQEVRRFRGHAGPVQAVAFSPDGRRVLSGATDNTIRLWDTATGRQLHLFGGHQGAIFSVAFSPGGGRAVSGSGDNTVRVWGLPR